MAENWKSQRRRKMVPLVRTLPTGMGISTADGSPPSLRQLSPGLRGSVGRPGPTGRRVSGPRRPPRTAESLHVGRTFSWFKKQPLNTTSMPRSQGTRPCPRGAAKLAGIWSGRVRMSRATPGQAPESLSRPRHAPLPEEQWPGPGPGPGPGWGRAGDIMS